MIYKVGDRVWMHHVETREVTKTCPVCAGTKVVTLILGSGESMTLPCDYCGKGFDGPRGVVTEREFSKGASLLTIIEVRTTATSDGEETEYVLDWSREAGMVGCFSPEKRLRPTANVCVTR